MSLTGNQRKQLQEALISAFPSNNELEQMVLFYLEQNLEKIAGIGKLEDVVFELIKWTEKKGRTKELIEGAFKENSGNPDLKSFVEQIFPKPQDTDESGSLSETLFPALDISGETNTDAEATPPSEQLPLQESNENNQYPVPDIDISSNKSSTLPTTTELSDSLSEQFSLEPEPSTPTATTPEQKDELSIPNVPSVQSFTQPTTTTGTENDDPSTPTVTTPEQKDESSTKKEGSKPVFPQIVLFIASSILGGTIEDFVSDSPYKIYIIILALIVVSILGPHYKKIENIISKRIKGIKGANLASMTLGFFLGFTLLFLLGFGPTTPDIPVLVTEGCVWQSGEPIQPSETQDKINIVFAHFGDEGDLAGEICDQVYYFLKDANISLDEISMQRTDSLLDPIQADNVFEQTNASVLIWATMKDDALSPRFVIRDKGNNIKLTEIFGELEYSKEEEEKNALRDWVSIIAFTAKGLTLLFNDDTEDASSEFQKAIGLVEKRPPDDGLRDQLDFLYYFKGRCQAAIPSQDDSYEVRKSYQKDALDSYIKALEMNENYTLAHLGIGNIYYTAAILGEHTWNRNTPQPIIPKKSTNSTCSAIEEPSLIVEMVHAYLQTNIDKTHGDEMDSTEEVSPDIILLHWAEAMYCTAKQFQKTRSNVPAKDAHLVEAKVYANLAHVYYDMAYIYCWEKDFASYIEQAKAALSESEEIYKEELRKEKYTQTPAIYLADTYYTLGTVYELEGDFKGASEAYDRCLAVIEDYANQDMPVTAEMTNTCASIKASLDDMEPISCYPEEQ